MTALLEQQSDVKAGRGTVKISSPGRSPERDGADAAPAQPVVQPDSIAAPDSPDLSGRALRVSGARVADARSEVPFAPIAVTSVIVATLIMFFGVGLPMWLLTGQIWDGAGLGAFTAFWGGPGFGLMAAGARWTARQERD